MVKNVLCESLNLQKSSKEMARCRDHPSWSFQMRRNQDSQNMKPLSTLESPEALFSCQAQKHTPPVHRIAGVPSLVVLSGSTSLHSPLTTYPSSAPFIAVCDVILMKQTDWSATIMALGAKFHFACKKKQKTKKKESGHETIYY